MCKTAIGVVQFELMNISGRPGRSSLQPVGQDLEIKGLAGGACKRGPSNRSFHSSLFCMFLKVGVLCDTFIIFYACLDHWRGHCQYLAVWRRIFSERVDIFEPSQNQSWFVWGTNVPQPGPAEISGRLLHVIFARVLTFLNGFSEMRLPGRTATHTFVFLRAQADMHKCEKLMVKRYFLQRGV